MEEVETFIIIAMMGFSIIAAMICVTCVYIFESLSKDFHGYVTLEHANVGVDCKFYKCPMDGTKSPMMFDVNVKYYSAWKSANLSEGTYGVPKEVTDAVVMLKENCQKYECNLSMYRADAAV
jgi:hypothetical protein